MSIAQDWHIHTFRSSCGKPENTVPAIVAVLDRSGMAMAGLSDHIDIPEQGDQLIRTVHANRKDLLQAHGQCQIFVGTEATLLSPTRCALDASLANELDFVIVACNHYHLKEVENPSSGTLADYARHHLDMIQGATELGYTRTVAHPFMLSKLGKDRSLEVLEHYPEDRLAEVLRAAARRRVALEINPGLVASSLLWFRDLVQEARVAGVRFTLGSDSHSLDSLGYARIGGLPGLVKLCDQIGLSQTDLEWMG